MAWPHPVEDTVDSLLSHMWGGPFGVLDSVRNSLHDILHPFASMIDTTAVWVWQHAEDAWNYAVKLYYQAVDFAIFIRDAVVAYAQQLYGQAVNMAYQLYNAAVGEAHNLYANVVGYAQQLYNSAVGLAQTLVDNVTHYAEQLYNLAVGAGQYLYNLAVNEARNLYANVVGYAQQLYNLAVGVAESVRSHVVSYAQSLYNLAVGVAQQLYAQAVALAGAGLRALQRDIIDPIQHQLGLVIEELFGWAKPLLRIIEGAAHWVEWVTTKALPDVLHAFQLLADFDPSDVGALMSAGHRVSSDQLPRVFNGGPARVR